MASMAWYWRCLQHTVLLVPVKRKNLKCDLNLDGSKVDSAIQFLHQFAAESVPHNRKTGYKRIPSSTGAPFCSKVASSNISTLIQELSHFNTRDICDGQGLGKIVDFANLQLQQSTFLPINLAASCDRGTCWEMTLGEKPIQ